MWCRRDGSNMTKTELRSLIVVARRFHADAVTGLDSAWKAMLGDLAGQPRDDHPETIERAATAIAPLLVVPDGYEGSAKPAGFVQREIRNREKLRES